ncbi:MAG: hypothetical protein KJO33_05880, partial [Gammaproteobacteria bacterium]|nr:hypothetical protein [Gammaproteobacteria bacterium]
IGRIAPDVMEETISPQQIESMQRYSPVHFIEYRGSSDQTGHGYFHSSPAVSSDLITLINQGAKPGSTDRPLKAEGTNFWIIEE